LFNVKGKSAAEVSSFLDKYGVCTRSGLHCAPLAHRTIGTEDSGAVRISFGAFNGIKDVEYTADVIRRVIKE